MASSNDELANLLRNLASSKSLNVTPPASTEQATLQKAQMTARDYGISSIQAAPNLQERIQQIASGKPVKQSGLGSLLVDNPVTKTALGALYAWDTPRRAVISGVREIVDILDSDPNTKASFGDFYNQAKDASYGFGTAFPMEGWKGRIIGFIGDIALDPMLQANLGSKLTKGAIMEGAAKIAGTEGEQIAARTVLGKHLVGAEARNKLAEWTAREMRARNAIAEAAGLAKEYSDDIIEKTAANVSSRGKQFVPDEIAKAFGLPKSGVYMFGSKLRVPFTGPIADAIESGLTRARVGIANTRPAEAILRKITRTGVGGTLAPLSAEFVRDARIGLAQGKMSRGSVQDALRLLNFDEDRRIAETFAMQRANKTLKPIFDKIERSGYRTTITRLLDNPTPEVLASASAPERALADEVRAVLTSMWGEVNTSMKAVDNGFKMGKVEEYFPWVLSDESRKVAQESRSARAEYILKYSKIDVNDVAGSFRSRSLHEGDDFFGVPLTQADLNIKRLNEIARPTLGFDMFESDANKALAYYANNYAAQMGNAAFFQKLASEPDMMKFIRDNFQVSPDVLESLNDNQAKLLKEVSSSLKTTSKTADKALAAIDRELASAEKVATKDVVAAKAAVPTAESLTEASTSLRDAIAEMRQSLDSLTTARTDALDSLMRERGVVAGLHADIADIEEAFAKLENGPARELVDKLVPRTSTVVTQGIAEPGPEVAARVAGGTFAELTPAENMTKEELAKRVQDELKNIQRGLRRTYDKFQSVLYQHNEIAFWQQHMDEARLGNKSIPFVQRFLDELGWTYSDEIYNGAKPQEIISRGGKIWQDVVRTYWATENVPANVQAVRNLLDPSKRMSIRLLTTKLNMEEVIQRLVRSTTTAGEFDKLQEAVAWLTLREIRLNPDLEKLMTGALDVADERTMQVYQRVKKLTELNEMANDRSAILRAISGQSDEALTEIPEASRALTGTEFKYVEDKEYSDLASRLKDVENQISIELDNASKYELYKMAQSELPIISISDNFSEAVANRSLTGTMTSDDLQSIISSLDDNGYVDLANAINDFGDRISYQQVQDVLSSYKEQQLLESGKFDTKRFSEQMKLLEEMKKDTQTKMDDILKKMTSRRRNLHETLRNMDTYHDLVREYSDKALELHVFSETTLQFNYLMDVMAPYGIVPSMNEWANIRADVASRVYDNAYEFENSFKSVVEKMQSVQNVVQAAKPSEQYGVLREEMEKLFTGKDAQLVRRFFPEFEAVLQRGKLSEFNRLVAKDSEANAIRDQLLDMYAQLTLTEESGRRAQRVQRVTGPGQAGFSEEDQKIVDKYIKQNGRYRPNIFGSQESQMARIQSGNVSARNLLQVIEDLLDQGAEPVSAAVMQGVSKHSVKIGFIDPADFENVLTQLRANFENVSTRIKAEQKTSRALAREAGLGTGRKVTTQIGATKEARAINMAYGFAGAFQNAISPNGNASNVRKFFGGLIGGTVAYDAELRKIKQFDFSGSYAGKTLDFIRKRQSALANLTDASVPVTEKGLEASIVPGLSGFKSGKDVLLGPVAYADALRGRAMLLRKQLATDTEFQAKLSEIGIKVADAKKGLPYTPEQIDALRIALEQKPTRVVGGPKLWRYIDEADSVVKSLPSEMQNIIYQYRDLMIREQRILNGDYFPVAQSEKLLHDVISELAPLHLDRIYDATGNQSFDPFSAWGKKVWNAPRPGVFDIAGNPVHSNVDSSLLETYLASLPERRGLLESPGVRGMAGGPSRTYDHYIIQAETIDFNPNAFTVDKNTGREISDLIFMDGEGVILKTAENGDTPFEQAKRLYNQRQPLTVLKPTPVRAVEQSAEISSADALRQAARIGNGDTYEPAKTWVLLPEEWTNPSTGLPQLSKPAIGIRMPINQTSGSRFAFTFQGKPLAFTSEEYRALFNPPIIEDAQTVTQLQAQIDQLQKDRPVLGRKSTKAQKATAKRIDAQVVEIEKQINDIFERPIDVKQISQLQKEIRIRESQIPTDRLRLRGAERARVDKLEYEIRIRQEQIDVIRARPLAEAKVHAIIDQLKGNKDYAYFLGATKRYGETSDDVVKMVRNMVKKMVGGQTPDGMPMAFDSSLLKVRKDLVASRFKSGLGGSTYNELGKIRSEIQALNSQGLLKDWDTQVRNVDELQTIERKIRMEFDDSYSTADTIQEISDSLEEASRRGFVEKKNGGYVLKGQDGTEKIVPELRPGGSRSVVLMRDDIKARTASVNALEARKRQFVTEVNKLERIPQPTEQQLARISEIRNTLIPDLDSQATAIRTEIGALDDAIKAVSAGFDGKRADEIEAIIEQMRSVKTNSSAQRVRGSRETLSRLREQYGQQSKQYRTYQDMLNILTTDKGKFDELQAAMKRLADATAAVNSLPAQERKFMAAQEVWHLAQANFDTMLYGENWSRANVAGAERRLENVLELRNKIVGMREGLKKEPEAVIKDFDQFYDEAKSTIALLKGGKIPKNLEDIVGQHLEQMVSYHASVMQLGDAKATEAVLRGIDQMLKYMPAVTEQFTGLDQLNGISLVREFDKGWVAVGKKFPNMQINPQLEEIFRNGHKMRDPIIAQELSRFLGGYTRFFKSYATLSPGFHVRNSIGNGLQMFFGGGEPRNLLEGLKVSIAWQKAEARGKTWAQFLATLTPEEARAAETARISVAASGGGMYSEISRELEKGGKFTNNKLTRASRRYGELADNHARFIFGYDAAKQGMDYRLASARTKRFFIDYQDTSDLDKTVAQIVPFWMWTSRNFPTQVVNMWLNPKPYLVYNSIKRNLRDDADESLVPAYLTEMGAFKLPFGNNLYLAMDNTYAQVNPTLAMLKDPQRMLSNLNPAFRLPIELAGNRQLYNDRQFSDTPVKVKGPVADVLQPLLQAVGWGQTNSKGEKFASDKALYALRSAFPMLGTAERLAPSIEAYSGRGVGNAIAGFTGVPVRQVTPQMQASALKALQAKIAQEVAKNKALEGNG